MSPLNELRDYVNAHPELQPTNREVMTWVTKKAGLKPPVLSLEPEQEAHRILEELRAKYGD